MTLLTFVRNLWNNAFPPQEPPAPPPEPELSCFVKGVIRSIETDTASWEVEEWIPDGFTHRETGLTVWYWDGIYGMPCTGRIHEIPLTDAERYALGPILLKHLVLPTREAAKRADEIWAAEQRAKLDPAVQHFSTLGCPPPQ